jgi:hypothetical protein
MRSRSREVNIFNMSLLDILTGMLGAFLFLMLGLVPYYTRAQKTGNDNEDKTPPIDVILNIVAQWKSQTKLDFFIYSSDDNKWHGWNDKSLPLSRITKIADNSCGGGNGWQAVSCYANDGQHYLLACSLQPGADPATLHDGTFAIQLLEAKSDPKGTGLSGYFVNSSTSPFDASGGKPGAVYALHWIEVTKDTSKAEYYQQYDFNWYAPSKHPLPRGVQPIPNPAPIPVTLVPVNPTPTSEPQSNPNAPVRPNFPNFPTTSPRPAPK